MGYIWTIYQNIHKNDGSGVSNSYSTSGTANVPQGSSYSATVSIHGNPFSRTGYNFTGYRDGGGTSWVPGEGYTAYFSAGTGSKTINLYCQWQIQTFTISYNANGGTGAPSSQTKTYGQDLTLSATEPTRTNYIFQGWSTSSTGAVEYQPEATFQVEANTTLYAIWAVAASTLSTVTSPVQVGSSGTATWNIIGTSYTYQLAVTFSNAPTVTVSVAANTSSTSFTIPTTWYQYIPNATSVTATATLTTYDGASALGSTSKTFTVEIPSTIKPTISSFTVSPYSTNATVTSWGVYVQGYSQANLSASATAGEGASIVSYAFSGYGVSQSSTTTTVQSTLLDTAGANTYTLVVTDSRGRTATATQSITVYEYSTPNISGLNSFRCLSNGTQSDTDGTYINSTPVFSFSSVNGNNSLSVAKIEYKQHSGSTWSSGVTPITSNNSYTYGGGNIDISKTYDVKCTITDALGNTATLSILVPPVVGFSVGLNNDRARFGGVVEEAGLVCDWDFKLKGDFVMYDGYGNTATMTYADLVSLLSGGGGVNVQQNLDGGLALS